METWLKDTSNFVKHTKLESKKCRTQKEVDDLVNVLEAFRLSNVPIQCERISKTSLLASKLQNADAKNRTTNLIHRQDNVIKKLGHLAEYLRARSVRITGNQENGAVDVSRYLVYAVIYIVCFMR